MGGIYLVLRTVADMTMDRALDIARVFDAHPRLRPRRVGGDPARIEVEPSMEAVVRSTGLPIDWLTVRMDEDHPRFESGVFQLVDGRGGWIGKQADDGMQFSLCGNEIQQHWVLETMRIDGAVAEAASLFEDLVVAADAAYGYVVSDTSFPRGLPSFGWLHLPGVFWLNYFGPAFLRTHPGLVDADGARVLATGGVLVQASEEPWHPSSSGERSVEVQLRELFGDTAFERADPNPALPSLEDHLATSPGTTEMPWEPYLRRKAADTRAKKQRAARRRLESARAGRAEPTLAPDLPEWSTNLDLEDWPSFTKHLSRRLGGELTSAIGKAALAVAATAPLDEEDGLVLDTALGPIYLGWFIDDTDAIDVSIRGSDEVIATCDAWLD